MLVSACVIGIIVARSFSFHKSRIDKNLPGDDKRRKFAESLENNYDSINYYYGLPCAQISPRKGEKIFRTNSRLTHIFVSLFNKVRKTNEGKV